jgi:hypothetical protein
VTLWIPRVDSTAAASGAFRRAGEMVDWLSARLGPFPYPALAHVSSPLAPAGRAGASIVLYDAGRMHEGQVDEQEVARATASQWFGNAVSETGPETIRPSPAVAAYLGFLWARQGRAGPNTVALPRDVDAIRSLHQMVGDSAFFRGLRRYLEAHRNSTAEPGELERVLSQVIGKPLGWSFRRAVESGR